MTVVVRLLAALILTLGFQTHAFVLAATSAKAAPCVIAAFFVQETEGERGIVSSETPSPSCKVIVAEPQEPARTTAGQGAPLRFEWPDHSLAAWNPGGLEKPPKGGTTLL